MSRGQSDDELDDDELDDDELDRFRSVPVYLFWFIAALRLGLGPALEVSDG